MLLHMAGLSLGLGLGQLRDYSSVPLLYLLRLSSSDIDHTSSEQLGPERIELV